MAKTNQRHIVRNPNGGWDIKKPGSSRVSSHHPTQAEAEVRAKDILARDGGGEVVIHRPDGTIRDSDTVLPGRDPFPPRDTRH